MSQELESQRKEAEAIVYRWFRYRVRRGFGVLYCLYSTLPVIGSVIYAATSDITLALIGGTIAGVCFSLALRAAVFRGFGKMGPTMGLLRGGVADRGPNQRARVLLFGIWPWIGYAVAASFHEGSLEALFAAVWLVELVIFRRRTLLRTGDAIVKPRFEDWLALVSFPVGALLSILPGLPVELHEYGFVLISPLFLFSGVMSLYEAPRELVDADERT
jgi:hypothetical protein